jgi:outer membrane protein OmpA-like peptidoglycan-associated protein
LLLACGVLLSATINRGTAEHDASDHKLAPLDAPEFSIESGRGRLVLQGTTASAAHESGLRQLAADHFDNFVAQSDFRPGVVLTGNWESTTDRLLYALAATESAQAVMQDHSIKIRGITFNAETFAARLEFLRQNLLADIAVDADVLVIDFTATLEELCARAFSRLIFEPVSFSKSSAEIRTASFVTLDRITDFAHDCQRTTIAIIGHTDASGDESWNRQLSLLRAQAVRDHIARNGIDPQRLPVNGFGSSKPIADNTTVHGRSLNRRIEFELR